MRSLDIDALNSVLVNFCKGFKVIEHDKEFVIVFTSYYDCVLRFTVDKTCDNRKIIAIYQVLVSKVLKHRLILSELLINLSLLFDGADRGLKAL